MFFCTKTELSNFITNFFLQKYINSGASVIIDI